MLKIKEKKNSLWARFVVAFALVVAHNGLVMTAMPIYGGSTMQSKFPGTCRKCREWFPAGTEINWSRDAGASHVTCPISSEPIVSRIMNAELRRRGF